MTSAISDIVYRNIGIATEGIIILIAWSIVNI
jgi:hypothetical protein